MKLMTELMQENRLELHNYFLFLQVGTASPYFSSVTQSASTCTNKPNNPMLPFFILFVCILFVLFIVCIVTKFDQEEIFFYEKNTREKF